MGPREPVHMVDMFYDGVPRLGIADYQGRPHYYKSRWQDDDDDVYELQPLDDLTFALARRVRELWLERADTAKAERFERLRLELDERLKASTAATFFARASFAP